MSAVVRIVVIDQGEVWVYAPSESERRGFIPSGRLVATVIPTLEGRYAVTDTTTGTTGMYATPGRAVDLALRTQPPPVSDAVRAAQHHLAGGQVPDRAAAVRALTGFDRLGELTADDIDQVLDPYPAAPPVVWAQPATRAAERRIIAALFPTTGHTPPGEPGRDGDDQDDQEHKNGEEGGR